MNNEMYPLTIIKDRYNGTYSGGMYLAFNLEYDEIPLDVSGSDMNCANFWKYTKLIVGKGANIKQAYDDLKEKTAEFNWR